MTVIRSALLTGAIIYSVIFFLELLAGHIFWQAVIGIGISVFLASLPFSQDEHTLHNGEMVAVWSCILLFGLYALLKIGGFI